jgi:hypothetical protein
MYQLGNSVFYSSFLRPGLSVIDVTDPLNLKFPPGLTSLVQEVGPLATIATLGEGLTLKTGTGTYFLPSQHDSFGFSGTPAGGSKGRFNVTLQAKKTDGNAINETTTCSFDIQPAVTPIQTGKLVAVVNQAFTSAVLPYLHVLNRNLLYTLVCPLGDLVSRRLSLNSVTRLFSGIPRLGDEGLTNCELRGNDPLSPATGSSNLQIEVTNSPALDDISIQLGTIGVPYALNLTASADSSSTISVTGLPPSFSFDSTSRIISGTPAAQDFGTRTITVIVTDANGVSTTKTYTLNVVLPGTPAFVKRMETQTVSTGSSSSFSIPDGFAFNENYPNAPIVYTASGLPPFMTFDGRRFTSKAAVGDKDFVDIPFVITVTAIQTLPSGQQITSSIDFTVMLTGVAWGQLVLGFTGVALALWRARKWAYNKCIAPFTLPKVLCNILRCSYLFRACKPIACYKIKCVSSSGSGCTATCCKTIQCYKASSPCCIPSNICRPFKYDPIEFNVLEGQSIDYTFDSKGNEIGDVKYFYVDDKDEEVLFPGDGARPAWIKEDAFDNRLRIYTEGAPPWNRYKSIIAVPKTKGELRLEKVTFKRPASLPKAAGSAGSGVAAAASAVSPGSTATPRAPTPPSADKKTPEPNDTPPRGPSTAAQVSISVDSSVELAAAGASATAGTPSGTP